jgi:tRNA threonylcarbamoyladenosine biosynthesis protein TsaE
MRLVAQSVQDMHAIAARLAAEWLRALPARERALVVGLRGELGAGKTTFVQGVAKALGVRETPASPTFNLMKEYPVGSGPYRLLHLDCYRLDGHRDLAPLDMPARFADRRNLILVEWPERVGDGLPADRIEVRFEHVSPERRSITVDTHPARS